MSRRIEIELTSARPDGSWTWRAAGAREPKGVVESGLLPSGAKAGSVLKADAEFELDGITILSVTDPKGKSEKAGLLEFIPSDKPFEEVTQVLAKRDPGERRSTGDRDRGPKRDRPGGPGGPRNDRGPRPSGGDGTGAPRGDRPSRPPRPGGPGGPGGDRRPPRDGDATTGDRPPRGPRPERRQRPNFTPPPELPQRPKAKRLKPGRVHRNTVLAELPDEQRPVAERALQGGIPAVRQAVSEQNQRLRSEGKEEIPAAGMLSLAEQLLPKLRVAEWLDRADAAKADLEELDLRDLRSVVAASDDPMVSRDETTRELAAELKQALVTKQEKELQLWFTDIDAAIGVGRIIRALKLSSQPPKAGIRFPVELAKKLSEAATASLTADAMSDRWSALLEAVAFSPVRTQVNPTARPEKPSDELIASVTRLAPLLPQIAALFGVEVKEGASAPKPLRPTRPTSPTAKKTAPPPPRPPKEKKPAAEAPAPEVTEAPEVAEAAPAEVEAAAPEVTEAPEVAEAAAEAEAPAPEAAEAPEVVEAAAEVEAPAPETTEAPEVVQEAADDIAGDPEPAAEEVRSLGTENGSQ